MIKQTANTLFAPNLPIPGALRERLVARATADGLLDIAYRTIDTRIGTLLLAATTTGLVRVAFDGEGHDSVLQQLADDISPRVMLAPRQLDEAAAEIDAYLSGGRTQFGLALDLRLATGFRLQVLEHLRTIPYGRTESYAAAATGAGRPAAVRAAASACSHNPLPLVIPCHRIVRSDGSIGEYLGGASVKRDLLEMEGAA
jgi:methylated-DNA-[protein]-cysteine S-methyltransferase